MHVQVIAAHLSHLNLPFSLMERALVVLARARVDTVDLSIDQADEDGQYCNQVYGGGLILIFKVL